MGAERLQALTSPFSDNNGTVLRSSSPGSGCLCLAVTSDGLGCSCHQCDTGC